MKNLRYLKLEQSLSKSDDFALSVEVLKMIPKQKEGLRHKESKKQTKKWCMSFRYREHIVI